MPWRPAFGSTYGMMQPLAVVIVSYNVRNRVLRALHSVADAGEIVVVDNASSDGTADAIARIFPQVRVLALPTNIGFGRAVNLGVATCRSDMLLVLNPDTRVPPGGLPALLAAFRRAECRYGPIGALSVRQVDEAAAVQLAVGPIPSLRNEALRCALQRALDARGTLRSRAAGALLDAVLRRPRQVAWASGACLLMSRQAFTRVGGFDPCFFLYFEDIDLCLRLGRAGLPIAFDPSVTVEHARGRSAAEAPRLAQRAYRHAQIHFARRWRRPAMARLVACYAQARGARAP